MSIIHKGNRFTQGFFALGCVRSNIKKQNTRGFKPMITETQKKWLETEYLELLERQKKLGWRGTIKLKVYVTRIQKRIDRLLEYTLWLAVNHPNILLGKSDYTNEYGTVYYRKDRSYARLKLLMLTLKALMEKENVNVELVLNEQ